MSLLSEQADPPESTAAAPLRKRVAWVVMVIGLCSVTAGALALIGQPEPPHPETAIYTDRQPGIALTAGFDSYQSVDATVAELGEQGVEASHRRIARPASPRYPMHVLDTLSLDYALLGTKGRLTIEFFNDRLYEIGFTPEDASVCAAELRQEEPQLRRDRNGRAERSEGNLRIASNVDLAISSVGRSLRTEPYVLWQDQRLIRERDAWDTKFGAIPFPAP